MWQGHGNIVGHIGPGQASGFGAVGPGQQDAALQIDTGYPVYDNFLVSGARQHPSQGPKQAGGQRRPDRGNAGRRQKNYKRLWEQIKAVGRGDALDADGRGGMPGPELSVEELVRLVSRLPPDMPCVPHVVPSLQYLDSRAFAAFMKDLAKNGHVARAMELFDWIKDLSPVHDLAALADVYTYTTAINNAGQAQQLRRALELVGEMRTRGVQCNVHTYSALMNVCIKCDACELALDVFKEMRTDGVRPNVVTYNTLVDVYGKIGQWERAVRVLDDMKQDGLEPEVRTFNTAIIACNMCGQPQEALKVYTRLLEAGLQPISTTYTALISAYAKGGQLDRALDTFKQMVREGCERSVITYSALINACEKAGQWELALQLFERMQQEGIAPNTVTYNSLITACTQGGQWEKASEVFDHMRYHNCRPDTVTYSALIGAFEKGGQWLRAVKAFEQMQVQGCRPDSSIYQSMVDMLWQSGVAWLQARALQLYASAARSWQFRFTVQQASPADASLVEFIVPASTASVAVLSAQRWLCELRGQLDRDGALLLAGAGGGGGGLQCERVAVSLGRGRHTREQGCGAIRRALFAMLEGLGAPLRPLDVGAAGGVVTVEAPMAAFTQWLSGPELPQALSALLLPAALASGQQAAAAAREPGGKRGGGGGGGGGVDVCQSDVGIEAQCAEAFNTVTHFELTHRVEVQGMSAEYLQARPSYIEAAFAMAAGLGLRQETAYDALLLMDRVMATGTSLADGLSRLFVAAALRAVARLKSALVSAAA
ncbi:MAG: hypothetical protein J3K34DRAFT_518985 [Monoraphidium minutum]|nr:MAG: hypothetical protein J3K34DRAFT_518985 [Monoraphidium minutum]